MVVSADVNHIKDGGNNKTNSNNKEDFSVSELNRRNAAIRDDQIVNTQLLNSVDQQRGYFTLPGRNKKRASSVENNSTSSSLLLPPPDHPPPPPPKSSQVIAVGTKSDYDSPTSNKIEKNEDSSPKSSFKPSDSAKLYASPENVQSVAFREQKQRQEQQQQQVKKRSPTRANSMPPRPTRPQVLRRSMVAEVPLSGAAAAGSGAPTGQNKETYSVNGVSYTTYTTFR